MIMADWHYTMQQTFEYYIVDPATWKDVKRIEDVESCTINRDSEAETLGSVTIDIAEPIGEAYVRAYLITIQNGVKEKHPLATFLIQTPASNYDGKRRGYSMDAYTPLLELKETPPPLGYSIFKDENILDYAYRLVREKVRAPVVKPASTSIYRNVNTILTGNGSAEDELDSFEFDPAYTDGYIRIPGNYSGSIEWTADIPTESSYRVIMNNAIYHGTSHTVLIGSSKYLMFGNSSILKTQPRFADRPEVIAQLKSTVEPFCIAVLSYGPDDILLGMVGAHVFQKESDVDTNFELALADIIPSSTEGKLQTDFVANINDTWLTFIDDLVRMAKHRLALDETGRILFAPDQEIASLQPVWTYNDDNSSILYPDISIDHDLYGIPNVVEVLYSRGRNLFGEDGTGKGYRYARVVNDDSNSPTSTVSRGREIVHRVMDPDIGGNPTDGHIQEYAEKLLKELSSIEYTVTYTHGYCPVRIGDCVRLNYSRAGLTNVKAKVISQSIKCEPGCPVTEKAVYTKKLWR